MRETNFTRRPVIFLACATALVMSAPALGGALPQIRGAKKADGPFKTFTEASVKKKKSLFIRVKSEQNSTETWTFSEGYGGDTADFKLTWFLGKKDVSHDVQTSGHDFKLKPDKPRIFRVVVKPQVDHPENSDVCIYGLVDDGGTPGDGGFIGVNGNLCN